MIQWIVVSVLALSILACASNDAYMPVPEHFSAYDKQQNITKAISADGVVYRVRTLPLKEGDVAFWKAALKTRMVEDAGYHFVSEQDLIVDGLSGYLIELQAPMGPDDFSYLIAIFKQKQEIIIIESAAEILAFEQHKQSILAAIKEIRF